MRPGEIRAADLGDAQELEGNLGILVRAAMQGPNSSAPRGPTKTRQSAWIPVDDELEAWLRWRRAHAKGPSEPLFPNPTARHEAHRWIANALREEWNRARKRAGVGVPVTMYEGTKHSSASRWLAEGARMEEVQAMLRHRDRRSTERYAKLSRIGLVEMVRRRK